MNKDHAGEPQPQDEHYAFPSKEELMLALERMMAAVDLHDFDTGTGRHLEDVLSGKVQLVKPQHQPSLLPEDILPDRTFLYDMMRYNSLYSDYFSPAEEEELGAEEDADA